MWASIAGGRQTVYDPPVNVWDVDEPMVRSTDAPVGETTSSEMVVVRTVANWGTSTEIVEPVDESVPMPLEAVS